MHAFLWAYLIVGMALASINTAGTLVDEDQVQYLFNTPLDTRIKLWVVLGALWCFNVIIWLPHQVHRLVIFAKTGHFFTRPKFLIYNWQLTISVIAVILWIAALIIVDHG